MIRLFILFATLTALLNVYHAIFKKENKTLYIISALGWSAAVLYAILDIN